MINIQKNFGIIFLVIAGCLIMAYTDAVLSPNYAVKSTIKLIIFFLPPLVYSFVNNEILLQQLFAIRKKSLYSTIILGLVIYTFILCAYFVLGPFFDFSNVTVALSENIGVTKSNFIYVALYISIINSLLEEFFFRGFAFLILKNFIPRIYAYIFSAGTFALYHIAIMTSWFSFPIFAILITSLFIGGLMFNWLDEKSNTIYTSWGVHMFANLAINTIGIILFRIV